MSLDGVSDAFLARRAAAGDGAAFAELACRYQRLILAVTRDRPEVLEPEDARQEALIGLFYACVKHDPGRSRFARFASVCVRSRVRAAARGRKHQVLSGAVRDGEPLTSRLVERVPAGAAWDPVLAVELRDQLRQRAELARQPTQAPGRDLRRRYSDQQISLALELIAEGKTLKEAAWAVGAPRARVAHWVKRAGLAHAGRRRFSPTEIRQAVALVQHGASLRQAGAAIGASNATVLRWLRNAA